MTVWSDVALLQPRPLGRVVRSLGVSATTTILSVGVLVVLTQFTTIAPATGNVVATVAGIGPSYTMNRRWAWKRADRGDPVREVLPFATYCVAALAVSTVAIDAAADWASDSGLNSFERTAAVVTANLSSFGSLWVGQFVLLSRIFDCNAPRQTPDQSEHPS
jgi:putative flippase GtrA